MIGGLPGGDGMHYNLNAMKLQDFSAHRLETIYSPP